MNVRNLRLAVAIAVTAFTLAACGSNDDDAGSDMPGMNHSTMSPPTSPSATADAEHNSADTAFAQQMIQHHRGAVEMSELAPTSAASDGVTALAARIEAAQQPEIDTMSAWLETWGEEVPADMTGMTGMDHGGDDAMPGMMTEQQMTDLDAASGAAFDRLFLQLMIEHHQGALTMAQQEVAAGQNAAAIELAEAIITSQTAEIAEMQRMLGML